MIPVSRPQHALAVHQMVSRMSIAHESRGTGLELHARDSGLFFTPITPRRTYARKSRQATELPVGYRSRG